MYPHLCIHMFVCEKNAATKQMVSNRFHKYFKVSVPMGEKISNTM